MSASVENAFPPLPKRIETERLVLRPFESGDVDDFFEYARDERIATFEPAAYCGTRTQAEEAIAKDVEADWTTQPRWAIEFGGRLVGRVGLSFASGDDARAASLATAINAWAEFTGRRVEAAAHGDAVHVLALDRVSFEHAWPGFGDGPGGGPGMPALMYFIAPKHWGQGIATEAAGAVVSAAFADSKVPKVWAGTNVQNIGSIRVLENLGMQREGLRRLYGEDTDNAVYGLLREEWERTRQPS